MTAKLQMPSWKWWACGALSLFILLIYFVKNRDKDQQLIGTPPVAGGIKMTASPDGENGSGPRNQLSQGGPKNLLTLDQSRQLIHVGMGEDLNEGRAWNAYSKAHPGVKKEMLTLLEDDRHPELHEEALLVLAYVATDADIPRLRAWLDKQAGKLSVEGEVAVATLFDTVGIMARRGSPAAVVWLREMATVAYWVPPKFWFYSPGFPNVQPAEYETLCMVMKGYSLSHPADLPQRVQRLLADVKARNAGEIDAYRIDVGRLAIFPAEREAKEREPIEPHLIEYLDSLAMASAKPGAAPPQVMSEKPVPPTVQRAVTASPKPVKLAEADIPEAERVALIEQATAATARFLKLAAEEKVDELLPLLMDNGKPLTPDRLERSDEYAKDVLREAPICQRLIQRKILPQFRPGSLSIARQLDADGKVVSEQVHLSLDLPGTAADVKELFPKLRGDGTKAENGDLIMQLRRIDHTWYWQPFGW